MAIADQGDEPEGQAGVGPVAAPGRVARPTGRTRTSAEDADQHHVRRHLGDRDARRAPTCSLGVERPLALQDPHGEHPADQHQQRRRRPARCRRGPGGAAAGPGRRAGRASASRSRSGAARGRAPARATSRSAPRRSCRAGPATPSATPASGRPTGRRRPASPSRAGAQPRARRRPATTSAIRPWPTVTATFHSSDGPS